jgi:hypothetical protein
LYLLLSAGTIRDPDRCNKKSLQSTDVKLFADCDADSRIWVTRVLI